MHSRPHIKGNCFVLEKCCIQFHNSISYYLKLIENFIHQGSTTAFDCRVGTAHQPFLAQQSAGEPLTEIKRLNGERDRILDNEGDSKS